jgi:hypothetical protein
VRVGCFGRLQIGSKLHLGTKKIWAVYEGVSIDAGSPIIIHGKLLHLKQPKILVSVQKVYHSTFIILALVFFKSINAQFFQH